MEKRTRIILAAIAVAALLLIATWKLRGGDSDAKKQTATSTVKRTKKPGKRRQILDPRKQARGTVHGKVTVVGSTKAIAGAEVCGSARSQKLSSAEMREPTCTKTNSAGEYTLRNLLAARYTVSASAPSYIPNRYRDKSRQNRVSVAVGQEVDGIDIALRGGGVELRGIVKDVGGGPVADALVSVESSSNWGASTLTRSSGAGEFKVWVAPGNIQVSAVADGYAAGYKWGTAPGQFIELFMTPESVLAGKVVELGTGTPVVGARVQLSRSSWSTSSGTAITDSEGKFRLTRLQPGRYKPVATGTGVYGEVKQSIRLGFAQTKEDVVIEVHPAIVVSGRIVIGKDKTPCPAGGVSLHDKVSGRRLRASIETDGDIVFNAVLPGKYKTHVRCSGYLSKDEYPDVEVSKDDVTDLEWLVATGSSIIGKITGADGKPVANARVRASAKASGKNARKQRTWGWARSEADGTYEMKGMASGEYSVRCSSSTHPSMDKHKMVTLGDGDKKTLDISLAAAGEIKGSVVDNKGTPVKDVNVSARGKTRSMGGSSRTKDDGTFVIKGVAAGEYRVMAARGWSRALRAPGKSDDDDHGVRTTVAAGETSSVRIVVESEDGVISGEVVDENGKPVTDAFIKAQRQSERAGASKSSARRSVRWGWWGSGSPIMTNTEGKFTVKDLSPGSYTVRAYRKGGGDGLAESVNVGSSVTITIKSVGSVSGTVLLADGSKPQNFSISVSDEKAGFDRSESFFRTNGSWSMTDLPAGTFIVSVSAAEGTAKQTIKLGTGQNREGVSFKLESRVSIRGRVIDLEDKTPVGGMYLWVSLVKGDGGNNVPSDKKKNISGADGRFELNKVPAGRIYVGVYPMDWENGTHSFARVLRTIKPGSGVIDVGDIPVAKRKLPRRARAGELGFTLKSNEPGIEPEQTKLIVALIKPDGPAVDSGLKVGDQITSIDGHDVSGAKYYNYYALSRVPEGTTLKLGLARGDTVNITTTKPK